MLRSLALCALLAAPAVSVAASAPATAPASTPSSGTDQLINQAKYWENQNRFDLARENWLKLLRTSPDNPSALAGLANAEAVSGRSAAAQVYLDRLKELHPDHPDIRRLETSIRQSGVGQDKLAKPRTLARQGKYQEAVDAYQAAFGSEIPGGRLGLEYYQTLAGTPDGWEPARAGIEKLAKDNFDEPIYQLAIAQHLTYRESTRREGISKLSELARQGNSVAAPARQALRQGLIWLAVKPGDEPLYADYLKRYGEDAQVSARLASLKAPAAVASAPVAASRASIAVAAESAPPTEDELRGQLVKDGFAALNNNQLDIATDRFQQAIAQYGETADALGGLGIVRLRQQAYPESRELLERASAKDRKRAARWQEALSTARFWEAVREAESARKAGDNVAAARELRRAIATDPKRAAQEPSVPSSLADVLVEQDQNTEAEKIYREVLRSNPDNADALRGLIGLLVKTKRLPEAIATAEKAPEGVRNQLGSFGMLKAQVLRDQAAQAMRAKDEIRAEGLLKDALLLDPESPWTRVDLARIYQRQNRVREANALIDGVMGASPVQNDAIYIKASLLAEQQNWLDGLQLLEQVPPASRTPAMNELQKRLWVRYQTQRAGVYSRAGQPQEAARILAEVEPYAGEMPELMGAMATAYADLGDEGRALQYMRQALARNSRYDPGLRLAYASLLFKLRQDTEFEVVMEDLLRRGGLNEQQNVDLANLRIGYRLRQADLVREEGDLARAYEYLEPLIRVNPSDPRLMMALARLYNDSKDFDKSLAIYQRVIAQNDKELDAYKGAIGAAMALNRYDDADALLERAFALDPNNPRLYALAGRAARGRGDDGRALELFQQALRLDAEQSASGPATATAAGGSSSQPMLQLIDPARSYQRGPVRTSVPEPAPRRVSNRTSVFAAPSASFFKTRAGLARRPVAIKTATHVAQRPVPRPAVLRTALRPVAHRADWRGDYVIPAVAHRHRAAFGGTFIKVSTPPTVAQPAQPAATVDQPSGYWTQDPRASQSRSSYKYVESLRLPSASAAPVRAAPTTAMPQQLPTARSEFPEPRRYVPPMSQSLSRPGGSLRDEVMGEMSSITGKSQVQGGGQSFSQPIGSTVPAPGYGRSGAYEVPRVEDYGYGQPAYNESSTIVTTPYYAPGAVYSQSVVSQAVPPPPPSTIRTTPQPSRPVYSNDPMLATPEFVLKRSGTESQERKDLLKEIGDLRAQRSPYAEAGLALRSRDGVEGLDRLYDIEAPVEVGFPATDAGRFKIRAVPVYLESGTTSGRNLPVYGAMGLALATGNATPSLRYDNSAYGTAVALGYEAGDFKADVGTSPLGFPVETIVGGLNWRPKADRLSFKIDVSRRSVTDSELSYAGVRDPATGLTWGGVTKTGGRLDMAYDLGKYGLYANGSYHILNGEYVPRNSVVEVGGGVYARAIETRSNRVTYGLNITAFGYDKNLRRFSFGHGGYFSPQSYLSVAIPVEWEGYRNRFSYKLGGALGLQAFKEDGTSQYPGDSGLQAALDNALSTYTGTLPIPGGYSSKRSTGVGFTFGGQFEYLLDSNLVVGARLALDNARDYNEASALGFVRYMFYPQNRVSFPPNLLLPYYNFGDPRL